MERKSVKKLKEAVARKIAAGEVIDRPYSVVRELLDNSIDAGSRDISLYLENGGISKIRLVDNGHGMDKEDLNLCYLAHATSKIESENDLLTLKSLGFRGEALSSISTCTKMEVISSTDGKNAHRLVVHGGEVLALEEYRGQKGTVISASDLFYSIPARRKFLKKPSAETTMCKNTFLEKALPFPDISFKFYSNDKLDLFLPASGLKERVQNAFKDKFNSGLIEEVSCEEEGFSIKAVLGRPELSRKDRKYMHIYTNNRRINEYAFIQALQYGYNEVLPGGSFPVAFVFIDIDSSLIDFNIHPAKREAKFRNLQTIHQRLVQLIKSFLANYEFNLRSNNRSSFSHVRELIYEKEDNKAAKESPASYWKESLPQSPRPFHDTLPDKKTHRTPEIILPGFSGYKTVLNESPAPQKGESLLEVREKMPVFTPEKQKFNFQYMGQIMDVFLLVSREDKLYIIDQHATHEKVIFNKLIKSPPRVQELLLPIEFETTEEEDSLIHKNSEVLTELGLVMEQVSEGRWNMTGIPSDCRLMDSELIDFVKSKRGSREDIQRELYSTIACRAAVKEGESLDTVAAEELIEEAFDMEQARCPHGRPVWFELSRSELYELVGRT